MNRKVIGLITAAFALPLAGVAFAGDQSTPVPSCHKYSDNSGYCYGYYEGARKSSNGSDSMKVSKSFSNGTYYEFSFVAYLSGQSYTCYGPSRDGVAGSTEILQGNWIYVTWDASGKCNYVQVSRTSQSSL